MLGQKIAAALPSADSLSFIRGGEGGSGGSESHPAMHALTAATIMTVSATWPAASWQRHDDVLAATVRLSMARRMKARSGTPRIAARRENASAKSSASRSCRLPSAPLPRISRSWRAHHSSAYGANVLSGRPVAAG